ncbi:YceI family protein [Hyphococcus flavus]|uniref:YceI family protein n=1 Tax=Hyphococcus flavus TaxID=1866326 RepID=A0AAF0CHF1_9PROT|nr:YceI family protein [Hyphococcus flavus]WDI31842.1 YceI family protein [Hyphococcus flavus]
MSFRSILASILLALGTLTPSVGAALSASEAPAGVYRLDPNHFSLLFRVDHLGFSHIVGRFNEVDATLTIDPANPEEAQLIVEINGVGVDTNVDALDNFLKGASMLNSAIAPEITFEMGSLNITPGNSASIGGQLSMAGQTHPVEFDVNLVGAGVNRFENAQVLGFEASGSLDRSTWGMSAFTPDVGDEVRFSFSGEFIYAQEQQDE